MFAGALPNHFATPPWLEQAPFCESAFDQVLSPHRAVACFGIRISFFAFAAAGFPCWAPRADGAARPARINPAVKTVARSEFVKGIHSSEWMVGA
jgi:hypothetical protein